MNAAEKQKLISVQAYLAGELQTSQKHEYLGGFVYAMAGARNVHNVIGGNVFAACHTRLRGRRCRPFNSDTKIRVRLPTQVRFYYPDTSVVCRPNAPTDSYQDEPVVLVEVLSAQTRRIDEGEKKDAYFTIASLLVYLLVEQDTAAVTAWRRSEQGFLREVYTGLNAVVPLPEIDSALPLAEVYEGVDFQPESTEGDRV